MDAFLGAVFDIARDGRKVEFQVTVRGLEMAVVDGPVICVSTASFMSLDRAADKSKYLEGLLMASYHKVARLKGAS